MRFLAGLSRNAAVKQVAEAEVVPRGQVWEAHAFFRRFDDDALARLGQIGKTLGKTLPMTCLRTLAMVRTVKLRGRCPAEIRRGGWEEARIAAMIRKASPTPRTGGPKIAPPRSLADGLFEVEEWCRATRKRFEAAWPANAIWPKGPIAAKDVGRVGDPARAVRLVDRAARALEKRLPVLAESAGARQGGGLSSEP